MGERKQVELEASNLLKKHEIVVYERENREFKNENTLK